jgi:hypothetical protein
MRGADIEIGGNAGVYLCGTYVEGAFASQAVQGYSVCSQPVRRDLSRRRHSARLSGTEMTKGAITIKVKAKTPAGPPNIWRIC